VTLDPFAVGIAANRLGAILEEQQATLIRTAFSTIVRESEDLACGVFDTAGAMVAQSRSGTPGHINAMATGVRHFVATMPPATLAPGDVLLTNDPWQTAGQINDFTVVTPVFKDGRVAGFFASTCHAPDVGGRILSGEASEVFEEGLRIPIMKLASRGELNEDLLAIIRANVRTPDETLGDLHAQTAGNEVGARGLALLLDELGMGTIDPLGAEICARSERAMRAAIAELPDGRYEHVIHSDGFEEPIELRLAATVAGEEIEFDFAGSSPQSPRGINLVFNYTHAYASFAMKAAVGPEVPHNAGSFRPVHVVAPEGSILNCRPPAPVASRHLIGHLLPGLIFGALEEALPERLLAGGSDSLWLTVWRGEGFNLTLFQSGGMGARTGKDGLNATGFPAAVASVPTEVVEIEAPLVQRERVLVPDSAGAGRWRGGTAQRSVVTCRTEAPWTVSVLAERTQFPPLGLRGGQPGRTGSLSVDGEPLAPKRVTTLAPEASVRLELPAGAGTGDPRERPAEEILADVVDGYVTIEGALRDYGVAIRYVGAPDALVRTPEDYEIVEDGEREGER
jgi:N-methylhydantoinase B